MPEGTPGGQRSWPLLVLDGKVVLWGLLLGFFSSMRLFFYFPDVSSTSRFLDTRQR